MAQLSALWQEWVADNPFVRRELRRWGRRGYAWKMPLWNAALPAFVLSGAQWLYLAGPAWLRPVLPPQPGTLMFAAAAVLQLFLIMGFGSSLLSLHLESLAERLDFIRALPMGHRELLLKMGIARSLMLAVAALAGLPAHLIALSYGGVDVLDVITYYALLLAVVSGPPTAMDITLARSARRAPDATSARQPGLDPWFFFRMILFQGVVQMFVLSARHRSNALGILGRVLPPGASQIVRLFPFALLPAAVRFLWVPRPFYHLALPPVCMLAAWWVLRRTAQTMAVAELWAREPVAETLPQERTFVTLPEETGREPERRMARRFGQAASALLFLSLAGFAWQPMVESGRLGFLVNAATPAGSVAVLFLLTAGKGVLAAVYRIRWQCFSTYRPAKETPAEMGLKMARPILVNTGLVLLACLLGAVLPWPDLPLAGAGLLLAAASGLLFAIGWRTALGPAPLRLRPGIQAAIAFGELAVLLLPVGVLWMGARSLIWHVPAALSPVYTVATLFPGIWQQPPLPPVAVFALPALLGALLYAVGRRRAPGEQREQPARTRRDPLDAWLEQKARRWDNALFTLEIHRQLRKPTGSALRVCAAVGGTILASGFFLGLVLLPSLHRSGAPLLQHLFHVGRHGIARGGFLALIGSGLVLAFTGFQGPMLLTQAVREEYSTANAQRRIPFLYLTGLTDREIVLGVLAARSLRTLPGVVAAVGGSLFWLILGLPFGPPWWVMAGWAWVVLLLATGTLTLTLYTFHAWRGVDWAAMLMFLFPIVPILAGFLGPWGQRVGLWHWVAAHRSETMTGAALVPLVLLALLPRAYRSAVRAVHISRTRRDVEVPATAPGA